MRDFVLPYKPEELLAQPTDERLWASNLPDVENWSTEEADEAMNQITRRVLKTQGRDLAEDKSFSLLFALLQAWSRLEEAVRARTAELLTDALHRLVADAVRLKKEEKDGKGKELKAKEKAKAETELTEVRTAVKVCVFYLRLSVEKALKDQEQVRKRRKNATVNEEREKAEEEAKERAKVLERQRCALLLATVESIGKGAMPWLWMGDQAAWQQVAEKVSDAGFLVLDNEQALKHKETRTLALRCIVEPLQQEGHDHSNILVATVSKLTHGLRGHELAAPFAADCVAMAHNTPLPRTLLVELTQLCTGAELASQGAFQRSLGQFISGLAERLPHVVMANISVLLELLNVDCYPLRSAMVDSIGSMLIAEGRALPKGCHQGPRTVAPRGDDEEGAEGQGAAQASNESVDDQGRFHVAIATKKDLLDTLLTRSTDKTVWVRVQVLRTLVSLVESQKALPKELWPKVLAIATKRMQDSACSARKAALSLVHSLIKLHPYGPTLKGNGDERAKTEQILRYIHDRKNTLQSEVAAEELKEAEEMLEKSKGGDEDGEEGEEGADPELPTSQPEQVMKRRRLGKKTAAADTTMEYEVDKALAVDAEDGEALHDKRMRELKALENMETCYADRWKFIELLDMTETRLRGLLISRTASDVTEAIGVVVELKRRGLPAAARAFNQILSLVWSKHMNVKDAAVEAFFSMHLEDRTGAEAVHSLLEMYQVGCESGSWTYTHLSSVSELIQQAAQQERIEAPGAIRELVRAVQTPSCPMALRTLNALCAADSGSLVKVLPQLAQLFSASGGCLGTESRERLHRGRLMCHLLQRLNECVKPCLKADSAEFAHVWQLSQHATQVVMESFGRGDVPPEWYGTLQAAMDLSFDLSAHATEKCPTGVGCPDKHWEKILEAMLCSVLQKFQLQAPAASSSNAAVEVGEDGEPMQQDGEMESNENNQLVQDANIVQRNADVKASASQLSGVIFMAGHFALRMVIYMESAQSLLKKKRTADEDTKLVAAREKRNAKKAAEGQAAPKKGKKGKKEEEEKKEDSEDEGAGMGMAGQEEREAEHFADMIESRILYNPKSALSRCRPLILKGLCDPEQRRNPVLRRVAAISLCKFMTVSKRFCQEHLQLLFSVLFPKAKDSGLLSCTAPEAEAAARDSATQGSGAGELLEDLTLRQALLIAVGDLLFRHPNVVEPWTDRLYNALGAPAAGSPEAVAKAMDLRLTAFLVLTHLVLNDMMKPRATFLTRALWLTACPHESTARVARILFQELSKRSNAVVYNLLPQIIGELAEQKEGAREKESTCSAEDRVSWVMQFIEKEKHIEGLIEKLSVRLEQVSDIKGMGAKQGQEGEDADEAETEANLPAVVQGSQSALETVSCLAHAFGAMNYSDRCIIRLHDVIVVRKGLNTAISYHPVVRECLMNIIEKSRKPGCGKGKAEGDAPAEPAAEGAAVGGGKASAAAAKAIDEIEQVINKMKGKKNKDGVIEEEGEQAEEAAAEATNIPTPSGSRAVLPVQEKKDKKGKRKNEDAEAEAGFEEEAGAKRGRKKGAAPAAAAAAPMDLAARMSAPAPTAPAVEKVKSGGEELRAALQAQKMAKKAKGKGKGKAGSRARVDDDEA